MNNRRRMKRKWQPYTFSTRKVWNADLTMAEFIVTLLKEYKKLNRHGYPGWGEADTPEKWEGLLDRFIYTFDQILHEYPDSPLQLVFSKMERDHPETLEYTTIENDDGTYTMKWKHEDIRKEYITDEVRQKDKEYHEHIKEGLQLFAKFFEDIWD